MTKTNSTQIEKAQTLLKGLRNNAEQVRSKGLGNEYLREVENCCSELEKADTALDALRAEVHARVKETNDKLAALKEKIQQGRITIRNNYPQEQWARFGVMDKK